ncbi:hypothetical protein F5B18DRAFT_408695 [Nemania serpens]|nr:hypothetical protein F5B18DRAFT_408695 [Nemania serpens]
MSINQTITTMQIARIMQSGTFAILVCSIMAVIVSECYWKAEIRKRLGLRCLKEAQQPNISLSSLSRLSPWSCLLNLNSQPHCPFITYALPSIIRSITRLWGGRPSGGSSWGRKGRGECWSCSWCGQGERWPGPAHRGSGVAVYLPQTAAATRSRSILIIAGIHKLPCIHSTRLACKR